MVGMCLLGEALHRSQDNQANSPQHSPAHVFLLNSFVLFNLIQQAALAKRNSVSPSDSPAKARIAQKRLQPMRTG